jgi:hypothetical protein
MVKSIKTFDPREFMELAIETMKDSINEPRTDGKISPSVGVVLIKPDDSIETAARGKLRWKKRAN